MTRLFRERNPNSPVITVAKGNWQDMKVESQLLIANC